MQDNEILNALESKKKRILGDLENVEKSIRSFRMIADGKSFTIPRGPRGPYKKRKGNRFAPEVRKTIVKILATGIPLAPKKIRTKLKQSGISIGHRQINNLLLNMEKSKDISKASRGMYNKF